jgi:hypothetical protein
MYEDTKYIGKEPFELRLILHDYEGQIKFNRIILQTKNEKIDILNQIKHIGFKTSLFGRDDEFNLEKFKNAYIIKSADEWHIELIFNDLGISYERDKSFTITVDMDYAYQSKPTIKKYLILYFGRSPDLIDDDNIYSDDTENKDMEKQRVYAFKCSRKKMAERTPIVKLLFWRALFKISDMLD